MLDLISRSKRCNIGKITSTMTLLSFGVHTAERKMLIKKKIKITLISVLVAGVHSSMSWTQQKTKNGMFIHTHSVITAT